MNNQSIRLIVSDIDGTILNDQHQVDKNLKEQIPLFKEEKHSLCLGICSLSTWYEANRARTRAW